MTRLLACRLTTVIVFAALLTSVSGTPATASIVDFGGVDSCGENVSLDVLNPYQGLNWTNFAVYTAIRGFPGFNNGIVSKPNAAFTGGDDLGATIIGKITVAAPFDFVFASDRQNRFSFPPSQQRRQIRSDAAPVVVSSHSTTWTFQ
jgi:hypothetical protein